MDSSTSKQGDALRTPLGTHSSWLLWGRSRSASVLRSHQNIGRRARTVQMFPVGVIPTRPLCLGQSPPVSPYASPQPSSVSRPCRRMRMMPHPPGPRSRPSPCLGLRRCLCQPLYRDRMWYDLRCQMASKTWRDPFSVFFLVVPAPIELGRVS